MARSRHIQIKGLEQWQQGLADMQGPAWHKTQDRILRTAGLRMQEYLDDLTPARTGRLKQSMSSGNADNIFEIKVGGNSYVVTGTAVEYAEHVNDGFTQQKGRFVPGEWRSGTFHYMPGAKEGMVLTGAVVPGARMFDKAMDYMESDMEDIMDFEFRRMYRELFG